MVATTQSLILASASPRRTQLLATLGVSHVVRPADIDETPGSFEAPLAYVQRMAASKAAAGVSAAAAPLAGAHAAVLAADTIVIADGAILGKPVDAVGGLQMLMRLSGRRHQVATAVCVRQDVRQAAVCVVTDVSFRSVTVQEAQRYWDSGEPLDKAGGYGIQGSASVFVSKIDGSYSSVIGLPLVETRTLLRALGLIAA